MRSGTGQTRTHTPWCPSGSVSWPPWELPPSAQEQPVSVVAGQPTPPSHNSDTNPSPPEESSVGWPQAPCPAREVQRLRGLVCHTGPSDGCSSAPEGVCEQSRAMSVFPERSCGRDTIGGSGEADWPRESPRLPARPRSLLAYPLRCDSSFCGSSKLTGQGWFRPGFGPFVGDAL
jgi:hypothetical protein